jgi:hypothetical protein
MSPTIIELFQSQGCSSCPPTNANLHTLLDNTRTQNPSLPSPYLLLTYHVTYWDHLGWGDTFGTQSFNDRQYDYVKRMGLRSAFTPQIVVQGRVSGVGMKMDDLQGTIREGESSSGPEVGVEVDAPTGEETEAMVSVKWEGVQGDLDLWLVKYDPGTVEVRITVGENAGKTLPHRNVVRSVQRIGSFDDEERDASFLVDVAGKRELGYVVLVQQGYGGPIVGAVTL